MTKEQIEVFVPMLITHVYMGGQFLNIEEQQDAEAKICSLRDLALHSLSLESVRSEARNAALEQAAKVAEMMFREDADLKTNAIAAAIRALQSIARVAEKPCQVCGCLECQCKSKMLDIHSTELRK